jgi:translation elongation factor EF-1alpha
MQRLAMGLVFGLTGMLAGCKKETAVMPESQFAFTVEEVFYIKPPIDRVIIVGTVQDGAVKIGDSVVVHTPAGIVPVVVETIESPTRGAAKEAAKGQQVGLRVNGIKKDQVSRGDKVTGKSAE